MLTLPDKEAEKRINTASMFDVCERINIGKPYAGDKEFVKEYFKRYYPDLYESLKLEEYNATIKEENE